MVLREGVDVNSLGVDISPSPANRSYSSMTTSPMSRSTPRPQPSTPNVVPPTPSPAAGPSASKQAGSSPASSSQDLFYDADDGERHMNRRSMYRSPGTSSSPDLATLLRKAKERGGVVGVNYKKEKRRESPPPPLPSAYDRATDKFSPSYSANSSLSKDKIRGDAEWVLPSSRQPRENGNSKAPKTSVRAKTSAFLGKMLGQNSVRERSKTDAAMYSLPSSSTYTPPALMNAFTPPVPPIPAEHRSPTTSPIADVFSTSNRQLVDASEKPLPQSPGIREREDLDEKSIVFVDKKAPLPLTPLKPVEDTHTIKRRSMSVGNADLNLVSPSTPSYPRTPEPKKKDDPGRWDDSTLHGILDDFKGELSQLDPVSGSSLDLRDPSTPQRQSTLRSKAGSLRREVNIPTSPLLLDKSETEEPEETGALQPAIIPPRTSSLQTRPGSNGIGSPRIANSSPAVRSPSAGLGARDTSKLRVLHRSTASSSEPSLVPVADPQFLSTPRRSSQQDLTGKEVTLTRFSSSALSPGGDDSTDMDTRGKELATRCWNEDEDFLAKEKIAEWLGGHGRINKLALRHYVDFFDFQGLRLDLAFRRFCAKLYLKGETQQVDRILEQFSRRYWDCNPGGLYGSSNIVHAVSYSLLLLNTDLHVADLSTRMSRNQFIKNTLTAIQTQLQPVSIARLSTSDLTYDDCSSIRGVGSEETEKGFRKKRSDSITSWNSVSREVIMSTPTSPGGGQGLPLGAHLPNGSTPSVQVSNSHDYGSSNQFTHVYGRAWENDMENLLKEMYNAIKSQQILQPMNTTLTRSSVSSLSPGGSGMMRNRSFRGQPDRLATLKRGSIRGLQSILSAQNGISPYSSNSSIDGRVSPSPSFATSTHEGMYGSSSSFLNPTLGFASNLSHTIIREAQEDDDRSAHSEESSSTTISISDEELALLGAPWAKEGMLCRKQYWESSGKRAKDKAWLDVFVVIQKGELNMFTFGDTTSGSSGTFGGGNWLANAHPVGTVQLAHSLAHSLPPPGYNRQRPYCMVLTLANGGVYFFQAGTEELVNEWVSTCNYWAARTSKEPLAGGVSNMEYGWNRLADPYTHDLARSRVNKSTDPDTDGISVKSGRSARSKFGWREGAATVRTAHSPWADKTFVNDWKAPLPPTVSSIHDEEAQLEALKKHVSSMKKDLELHNELREPMAALYQPRTANSMKAQSNWERKSQYLLTEIVKYDSYIDSLQAAMSLRLKKRGEKALERALSGVSTLDERLTKGNWKGRPKEQTINEEVEPLTPGAGQQFMVASHQRERAEVRGED